MDGDNVVCHHCHPALSPWSLHCADVVGTGFLVVVDDVVFPHCSGGVGMWQGSTRVVGCCGHW